MGNSATIKLTLDGSEEYAISFAIETDLYRKADTKAEAIALASEQLKDLIEVLNETLGRLQNI